MSMIGGAQIRPLFLMTFSRRRTKNRIAASVIAAVAESAIAVGMLVVVDGTVSSFFAFGVSCHFPLTGWARFVVGGGFSFYPRVLTVFAFPPSGGCLGKCPR
ncbi:hypothetical protein [Pasteuria penetrans]|uniref:hypothetical protein n=1 Tax=Pasteuria penetrans TaxID=86005 RepID=UPI000FA924B2|nr:hypothetical protein [Pasteuria penetrans]